MTADETPSMMPEPTESAPAPLPIPKKNVVINDHGATAKIRNPWLVALFSLITIGIYYLFWYYFVNREMADYGEANKIDIGLSPGMSVVAITIGSLIIVPPFVSIFHTGTRADHPESRRETWRSAGLFFLLSIIPIGTSSPRHTSKRNSTERGRDYRPRPTSYIGGSRIGEVARRSRETVPTIEKQQQGGVR